MGNCAGKDKKKQADIRPSPEEQTTPNLDKQLICGWPNLEILVTQDVSQTIM